MTKKLPDASNAGWLERFMAGTKPADRAVPAFRSQPTQSEHKVDERTRVVRALTEAATEKRTTTTARLKAARLSKEAEDRAKAAPDAPKKKGRTNANG